MDTDDQGVADMSVDLPPAGGDVAAAKMVKQDQQEAGDAGVCGSGSGNPAPAAAEPFQVRHTGTSNAVWSEQPPSRERLLFCSKPISHVSCSLHGVRGYQSLRCSYSAPLRNYCVGYNKYNSGLNSMAVDEAEWDNSSL